MLLEFAANGMSYFSGATTTIVLEVNAKAKDMENCRFTLQRSRKRLRLIFRILVSASQLSLDGVVAETCEEFESFHDRSGRLDMVMGQSIVLSEIQTEVPLENDDPAYQNFLFNNMKNELRNCFDKIN